MYNKRKTSKLDRSRKGRERVGRKERKKEQAALTWKSARNTSFRR